MIARVVRATTIRHIDCRHIHVVHESFVLNSINYILRFTLSALLSTVWLIQRADLCLAVFVWEGNNALAAVFNLYVMCMTPGKKKGSIPAHVVILQKSRCDDASCAAAIKLYFIYYGILPTSTSTIIASWRKKDSRYRLDSHTR